MDDYIVQALNVFSAGVSRAARSQPFLENLDLTDVQKSELALRSFDNALKTFSDGLQRLRSTKARHHNTLLPISRLPNELIVKIFAIATAMKEVKDPLSSGGIVSLRRTRRLTLGELPLVCHEWRDILRYPIALVTYPLRSSSTSLPGMFGQVR
ncbi:hypothetical protein FRB95_012950 [Tulasnella sp. JGI-2019a]|nr:hypothetical protein FRB95_012950 [Tulasnella sp. JGI-2019a]